MRDIFADLYNKVLGFFKQAELEENVKDIARNRLRVVLMQDRTNLNPELLERMRKELIELLSKYVEMDREALELNFEQEGDQMALMLSIPVLRAKEDDEIEEAVNEDENLDSEETSEDEDSENESEIKSNEEIHSEEIIEEVSNETENNAEAEIEVKEEKITSNKKTSNEKCDCADCAECNECEVDDKINCEFKKKKKK